MIRKTLIIMMVVATIFIVITGVVSTIGARIPAEYTASATAVFPVPQDTLWAVLTDFAGYATWRPELTKVEMLPSENGLPVWREFDIQDQNLPYRVTKMTQPSLMVIEIAEENLPYSGEWTTDMSPHPNGCQVKITEHGKIEPVMLRFVMKHFFRYDGTVTSFMANLEKRVIRSNAKQNFGENTQ